jgi:hypothetical protein
MTDQSNIPTEFSMLPAEAHDGPTPPAGAFRFDIANYMHFLAAHDLTDAQKWQLIEALGEIILPCIDQSFGTHPVQLACGKLDKRLAHWAATDSDGGRIIEINPDNGPD